MSPSKNSADMLTTGHPGLERSPAHPRGPAEATPVSDLMTRDVVTVEPDLAVDALTAIFLERGISGAPVVDTKGHPVGIVSKTDVLRDQLFSGESVGFTPVELRRGGIRAPLDPGLHVQDSGPTVRDVMTPLAFAMPEDASIARASALMALEGVHRVVVVDPRGKVSGILSSLDVLRWLARAEGYAIPPR